MIPERGNILHLQFDPSTGKEMKGNHFCLVVSPRTFNKRFGLAMVCPISGGMAGTARDSGFLVSLMGHGLRTDGSVHVHQIKTLDWMARRAVLIESIPDTILQDVISCLIAVFEDD